MAPGDQLVVSAMDNENDPHAVGVFVGARQVGWVPKDLSQTVRGLHVVDCLVRRVGTDGEGNWTQLHVDLKYVGSAVKSDQTGALPKSDRAAAALELQMLADAGIEPEGVPKRRRKRST